MKVLFLIGTLAFSGTAVKQATSAKETSVKKVSLQPEFKPHELPASNPGLEPVAAKNEGAALPAKSGMKVTTGCKTASGLEYRAGEPGYDSCLSQLQMNRDGDKKDGSGTSVNFTFGN